MYKKILTGALIVAASAGVNALEVSMDLSNPSSSEDSLSYCYWGCSSPYAMAYNYELDGGDGMTAKVSGWSYDSAGTIEPDYVGNWTAWGAEYGLGVEVAHSPDHSIDNYMSDYDMLLIEFSQEVELSGVEIGWRGNQWGGTYGGGRSWNSELTVLAYDSSDDFGGFAEGETWNDLLDDAWAHAGDTRVNYVNSPEAVNTGGLVSKYWLVGAYNSTLGGSDYFSDGNDFFKLTSITAQVNPVPLPGSMLMFGLALLGAGVYRRKTA